MGKAFIKSRFMIAIATKLVSMYVRTMLRFSTIEVEGIEAARKAHADGKGVIVAFWHQRLILSPVIAKLAPNHVYMLASMNRDTDIMTKGVQLPNLTFVRGSSANPLKPNKNKNGAPAILQLAAALKNGDIVAFTPDGPRGPAQKAQLGIVKLAAKTGAPIIPIGLSGKSGIHLKSWDQTYLVNPFGTKKIIFGEPIYVNKDQDIEFINEKQSHLTQTIQKLTDLADKKVGKKDRSGHNIHGSKGE